MISQQWPSMRQTLTDHRLWKQIKNPRRLQKIVSPVYLYYRLALEYERLNGRSAASATERDLLSLRDTFMPNVLGLDAGALPNDTLR